MGSALQANDGGVLRPSRRAARLSSALAAALAAVVLLTLLGHRSLAMWDEGIYAEVAREMLGRNPLVPTWNFHPWFEKPPLLLWMTAALFRVFGVTEFWARAASALSGVATVALIHRVLARRFGLLAAWAGSVILLSTFGFLHVCRAGEMDALLALSETAAVVGLMLVNEQRRAGWLLFWLGCAAALMTKGAASIVLPLALVSIAAVERWRARHFGRMFFAGLGLFLTAVLPWHILMWQRFGQAFTSQYLGLHVLARASSQIEGHHTHAWYFLLVLLVSAPPWVLFYPSAVIAAFRDPELRSLRVLATFALVVVAFFSAVQTRLPHYVAPAYPALSAVTGVVLARWLRLAAERWRSAAPRMLLAGAAAVVWAFTILVTAHARRSLHSPRMSNGVVTPDTHEPAALLKRALRLSLPEQGPLLLLASPPIAPLTTALFYAQRPVRQVEISVAAPMAAPDEYTWDPVPLVRQTGEQPRLMLAERTALAQLPPQMSFTPIASSAHWELGSVVRRRPQP